MKTATFESSVNVLVKAFLNGTLEHTNCEACAVGNLVGGHWWRYLFITDGHEQYFYEEKDENYGGNDFTYRRKKGLELIEKSGYDIVQLAKIEFAFETAHKGNTDDEWMFNGLMAVVNVLAQIHNVDLSVRESAKQLFVKA